MLDEKTRQKIAITRALIRNPRILIIDEFSQPYKVSGKVILQFTILFSFYIYVINIYHDISYTMLGIKMMVAIYNYNTEFDHRHPSKYCMAQVV